MNPILEQRNRETYTEAIKILNNTGKCAILRPTGFGKTVIMAQISRRYKKVLYVYPTEIVHKHMKELVDKLNSNDGLGSNITYMTYSYLGKMHDKLAELVVTILKNKYDLIIFDELHHMGARLVKETLKILELLDGKIHILGGTATPDRMDGFDIIGKYFENSITSFYGIDNLVEDGLIPPPYYVYSFEGEKMVVEWFRQLGIKYKKTGMKVDLRKKETQVKKILNAPIIIKNAVNEVYDNIPPQYMRFMVFFSTKKILSAKVKEVVKWFKIAFPQYIVNEPLIIHSGLEEKQNIEKIQDLKNEPNTIDLIFSINMLNEGYHADSITGCILLRPTQSQAIYTQQVGRSLQVGMEWAPIIIDFVDNLNTHALFGVNTRQIIPTTNNKLVDDINKLNVISDEHIIIKDKIAEVKRIMKKLNSEVLKVSMEKDIIKEREEHFTRAADIAERFDIPVYKVLQVLYKHNDRLASRVVDMSIQEEDRYSLKAGERRELDEFDEYMRLIKAGGIQEATE